MSSVTEAEDTPPVAEDTLPVVEAAPQGEETPPPDREKKRRFGVLRDILEPIAHIATAIAIGVAIYQLIEARQDRRIDAALDLAARFDDEQVQVGKSKHLLELQWWAHEHELETLRSLTPDGTLAEPQLRAFVTEVILDQSGARRSEMRAAVGDVTKYFDQIGLCVSENRCDRRVTADYFCRYASNFHSLFGATINGIRQNFGNVGLGQNLAVFVENECAGSKP